MSVFSSQYGGWLLLRSRDLVCDVARLLQCADGDDVLGRGRRQNRVGVAAAAVSSPLPSLPAENTNSTGCEPVTPGSASRTAAS